MALALLVAACGGEAPSNPAGNALGPPGAERLPVMGPERLILLIETPLIDGAGLEPDDSYPARLETALRARGVNGRLVIIRADGSMAALKAQIARLQDKPALALVSGTVDAEVVSTIAAAIPVHRLDLETPLQGKPDLFARGGKGLTVQGVEELVGATADGIAQAMPRE